MIRFVYPLLALWFLCKKCLIYLQVFLPNKNQNGNLEYLLALRLTISSSSPARRAQCRNARCFFIHTQHLLPVPLAHGVSTEHVFLIHCVYVLHYCCLVLVIDNYFHKKFARSRQHHYTHACTAIMPHVSPDT